MLALITTLVVTKVLIVADRFDPKQPFAGVAVVAAKKETVKRNATIFMHCGAGGCAQNDPEGLAC